ncbi:unnamed protein product, partial [Iphiclides podalirius]
MIVFLFLLGFSRCLQAAQLICYNGTLENPKIVPLESPLALINSSCIDTQRVTKFFVHGYNRSSTNEECTGVMSAYISRGGVNTIVLDWGEEAKTGVMGVIMGYFNAVKNTAIIGKQFADALLTLADAGLDFDKTHLVGHSLGAQVSGITGNLIKRQGKAISRITGLDPALPLYEGLTVIIGINKDSASFVDVIHSDAGQYGIMGSAGTADFWPNYRLTSKVQPGCPTGPYPLLNEEGLCSHTRSWMFFIESIYVADAFLAASEPNYETWIQNNGTTEDIACMGEYVSNDAQGNYYLDTNGQPPYGKGKAGLTPNRGTRS